MRASCARGKRLQQPLANGRLAALAGDLLAGEIGHVEHVDRLLAEGGDMRRGDVEIEIGDLARHVIEQAGAVEPVDLDDGQRIGQRVVDRHLRLDGEGREPAASACAWWTPRRRAAPRP